MSAWYFVSIMLAGCHRSRITQACLGDGGEGGGGGGGEGTGVKLVALADADAEAELLVDASDAGGGGLGEVWAAPAAAAATPRLEACRSSRLLPAQHSSHSAGGTCGVGAGCLQG